MPVCFRATLAVLASLVVLGCSDETDATTSPDDGGRAALPSAGDGGTKASASYATVQALFASYGCGVFGCHGSGFVDFVSRDWIDLSAESAPVDKLQEWAVGKDAQVCTPSAQRGTKRVVPNSPETSYLIQVLRGTQLCEGTVRMPPLGPYLTEAEIQLVEHWIRALKP